MNRFPFLLLVLFTGMIMASCSVIKPVEKKKNNLSMFFGNFVDDYGSNFTINDTLWTHQKYASYRILEWHPQEQYLLAQNSTKNPADGGLFTRIDFMKFENMEPYEWGFCLTEYKASTLEEASKNISADRKNPKKGCNGYPFSRMKRVSK